MQISANQKKTGEPTALELSRGCLLRGEGLHPTKSPMLHYPAGGAVQHFGIQSSIARLVYHRASLPIHPGKRLLHTFCSGGYSLAEPPSAACYHPMPKCSSRLNWLYSRLALLLVRFACYLYSVCLHIARDIVGLGRLLASS